MFFGGNRTRTGDFLLAKQTLYQLSYTPGFSNLKCVLGMGVALGSKHTNKTVCFNDVFDHISAL